MSRFRQRDSSQSLRVEMGALFKRAHKGKCEQHEPLPCYRPDGCVIGVLPGGLPGLVGHNENGKQATGEAYYPSGAVRTLVS